MDNRRSQVRVVVWGGGSPPSPCEIARKPTDGHVGISVREAAVTIRSNPFAPDLRHRRYSSRVVSVVSLPQEALRTPRPQQVVGHLSCSRRAPRIRLRADLVRPVHRRSAMIVIESYGLSPHMYADDTGVRFVSSVCCDYFHDKGF